MSGVPEGRIITVFRTRRATGCDDWVGEFLTVVDDRPRGAFTTVYRTSCPTDLGPFVLEEPVSEDGVTDISYKACNFFCRFLFVLRFLLALGGGFPSVPGTPSLEFDVCKGFAVWSSGFTWTPLDRFFVMVFDPLPEFDGSNVTAVSRALSPGDDLDRRFVIGFRGAAILSFWSA